MSNDLPDMDALGAVTHRFEAAQAEDAALAGASLEDVMRIVPEKRAILAGTFAGRAAVFRFGLEDGSKAPARQWAELTRIWPHMQSGPLTVAEPLHFNEDHSLIVVARAGGTPMLEHFYGLDKTERGGLMQGPADWLRAYTSISETRGPSKAQIWLERAEGASAKQPHAKLQRRERRIISVLRKLSHVSKEEDWRFAICHGDFHPNNLLLDGARLTGIDLGGSASMPIYKDIARFLMHMGRRGMLPSRHAIFGVDREGFDTFASAFQLSPWERDVVMPFMLGVEALLRVEGPNIGQSRVRRARKMYDLLIADLEAL